MAAVAVPPIGNEASDISPNESNSMHPPLGEILLLQNCSLDGSIIRYIILKKSLDFLSLVERGNPNSK